MSWNWSVIFDNLPQSSQPFIKHRKLFIRNAL